MHLITLMCFRQSRLEEISSVQPCEHNTHRPSDSSLLIHMKFQSRGKSCGLSQSSRRTIASNPESMSRKLTAGMLLRCLSQHKHSASQNIYYLLIRCVLFYILQKKTRCVVIPEVRKMALTRSQHFGPGLNIH